MQFQYPFQSIMHIRYETDITYIHSLVVCSSHQMNSFALSPKKEPMILAGPQNDNTCGYPAAMRHNAVAGHNPAIPQPIP